MSREKRFASTLYGLRHRRGLQQVIPVGSSGRARWQSLALEWRKKREDRAGSLITGLTGNAVRKVSFRRALTHKWTRGFAPEDEATILVHEFI